MKIVQRSALKEKGWNEKEISRVEQMVNTPRPHDVHFSKIVFWSALIVIVFANLVVSIVLIPFLAFFEAWSLYFIVAILAGCIGFLYRLLIHDIGHLERKHHLLAGILVPIIAAVNMVLMVVAANQLGLKQENPWIVAGIFAVIFILPSLLWRKK